MGRALLAAALSLVALAVATAGCDSGADNGVTSPGGTGDTSAVTQVHVHLDEWTIEPDVARVPKTAELIFDGHNHGGIPHELIIIRTDLDAHNLPVSRGKVDGEAAGEVVGEITVDELSPGTSVAHKLDLAPGRYVLICNVAGHYSKGMYAPLTIE